jgi:tRNA G18 (ribose-2'-O)-methylase SpoU
MNADCAAVAILSPLPEYRETGYANLMATGMSDPRLIPIESLSDPRMAPYANLKDRDLAREGGRFLAEGELIVRRLLASNLTVESILTSSRRAPHVLPLVPPHIPVYCAPAQLVNSIVGYKFHSGVMAVGIRPPSRSLSDLTARWGESAINIVVLPEVASSDNLGSMVRIARAFGAGAVLLGEHACDPYFRHSVRVSMGAVFYVPIVQSRNVIADLRELRQRWGVELVASVLDEDAEPLANANRSTRMGFLFGNEAQGLRQEHIAACDRRVTIPMRLGTDSLNVSVAAGIVLYHFTHYAVRSR